MNSRRPRRRPSWAQLAAVGCLLVAAPPLAHAAPEVVAVRGVPSSLSAEFGPVVAFPGGIAAPTGSGVDLYDIEPGGSVLLGRFRTAGAVTHAASAGSTLFLFAGTRGIVAVDASNPAAPTAVGSIGDLGDVALGAADSQGHLLAASGSTLHFLDWNPTSGFALRRSVTYADGRVVNAIAARGDSFLVAATRGTATPRLILMLYRFSSGATAPESLGEVAFNGHRALDLAWSGGVAFVADGNLGILVIDVAAGVIRREVAVQSTKLVRSVDANDSVLVAATEGRTLARYRRAGAAGDSLTDESIRVLAGDPIAARLSGPYAIASTYDQIAPAPPEESGVSLLEVVSFSGFPEPLPVGGTGRVRRVAVRDGLAYVADYTGGLRIYRAGGSDSSLVGVAPPAGNGRAVDVVVDPVLPLVYLASGPAGLDVVQVVDPAAPQPVASMTFPGSASAVARVAPNLLAVARRGLNAGVSFVQIDYDTLNASVLLTPRGSIEFPSVQDPRALAARDTVLFVADEVLGLFSINFANPDLPTVLGPATGFGARDLDLSGTQLLVATRSRGLQIVDVANPLLPILRGEFPAPPLLGVARNGSSAVLFLGEPGALVVDVGFPAFPVSRGPIAVPGRARDGWWGGDTLLVAASLGLERFTVSPLPTAVPALDARLDPGASLPRALISWEGVSYPGLVGLNLYRDLIPPTGLEPVGRLVNRELLPPQAQSALDDSLTSGATHRYRLEAFLADGSSVKVAEGTLSVSSAPRIGRVYPNPFRPRDGARASLSYRAPVAGAMLALRVFDVRGRMIREIRTPSVAGFGAVVWDGRGRDGDAVPSGVYYLRLTGGGLDDARAVVLLR